MQLSDGLKRYAVFFFGAYLGAAIFAFWPRYWSDPTLVNHGFVHLHAAAMSAWLCLLTVQGLLARLGRWDVHRLCGKISFILAPMVIVTLVLVAHIVAVRVDSTSPTRLAQVALQLSYPVIFALFFGMALRHRHDPGRHSRWMLCTVLIGTSAIFDRLLFFYFSPVAAVLPRFIDGSRMLPMIYVILGLLAAWDWRSERRGGIFLAAISIFGAQHFFAWVAHQAEWWRDFTLWFMGLPLS